MVLMKFHRKVSPFDTDCSRLAVVHVTSLLAGDDDDISITALGTRFDLNKVFRCILK